MFETIRLSDFPDGISRAAENKNVLVLEGGNEVFKWCVGLNELVGGEGEVHALAYEGDVVAFGFAAAVGEEDKGDVEALKLGEGGGCSGEGGGGADEDTVDVECEGDGWV